METPGVGPKVSEEGNEGWSAGMFTPVMGDRRKESMRPGGYLMETPNSKMFDEMHSFVRQQSGAVEGHSAREQGTPAFVTPSISTFGRMMTGSMSLLSSSPSSLFGAASPKTANLDQQLQQPTQKRMTLDEFRSFYVPPQMKGMDDQDQGGRSLDTAQLQAVPELRSEGRPREHTALVSGDDETGLRTKEAGLQSFCDLRNSLLHTDSSPVPRRNSMFGTTWATGSPVLRNGEPQNSKNAGLSMPGAQPRASMPMWSPLHSSALTDILQLRDDASVKTANAKAEGGALNPAEARSTTRHVLETAATPVDPEDHHVPSLEPRKRCNTDEEAARQNKSPGLPKVPLFRDQRSDVGRPDTRPDVDRPGPRPNVGRTAPRPDVGRTAPRPDVGRTAPRPDVGPTDPRPDVRAEQIADHEPVRKIPQVDTRGPVDKPEAREKRKSPDSAEVCQTPAKTAKVQERKPSVSRKQTLRPSNKLPVAQTGVSPVAFQAAAVAAAGGAQQYQAMYPMPGVGLGAPVLVPIPQSQVLMPMHTPQGTVFVPVAMPAGGLAAATEQPAAVPVAQVAQVASVAPMNSYVMAPQQSYPRQPAPAGVVNRGMTENEEKKLARRIRSREAAVRQRARQNEEYGELLKERKQLEKRIRELGRQNTTLRKELQLRNQARRAGAY